MRKLYSKPSSIIPGDDPALLSTWVEGTEDEARADIGRRYSQVPTGKLVEYDIQQILDGREVSGKTRRWRLEPKDDPFVWPNNVEAAVAAEPA
jgi:hypothetical protein